MLLVFEISSSWNLISVGPPSEANTFAFFNSGSLCRILSDSSPRPLFRAVRQITSSPSFNGDFGYCKASCRTMWKNRRQGWSHFTRRTYQWQNRCLCQHRSQHRFFCKPCRVNSVLGLLGLFPLFQQLVAKARLLTSEAAKTTIVTVFQLYYINMDDRLVQWYDCMP